MVKVWLVSVPVVIFAVDGGSCGMMEVVVMIMVDGGSCVIGSGDHCC